MLGTASISKSANDYARAPLCEVRNGKTVAYYGFWWGDHLEEVEKKTALSALIDHTEQDDWLAEQGYERVKASALPK